MERHRTASAVGVGTRSEGRVLKSVADPTTTAFNSKARTQADTRAELASSGRSVLLASVGAREHTLILTGELDRASAPMLEAAIERVCAEGVTAITLDLRELTYIDRTGVAVIAFRCGLCKRRGYDLSLIPGSRFIQRAFERAGVTDVLPFDGDEVTAARLPAIDSATALAPVGSGARPARSRRTIARRTLPRWGGA
jgi:anti-anti-sigma factor